MIRIPGSKSYTHRAYVLAARSDQPCTVASPLRAADPDATLGALHRLGARVGLGEHITFQPADLVPADLDLRNAGTGLRLLTAQCATLSGPSTLSGDASLSSRPSGPLLEALASLGATVESRDGRCPIRITGPIRGGDVAITATSSQYVSALMLALPLLEGDSVIHLQEPIRSRPYLDITARAMRAFGLHVDFEGDDIHIHGGQVPSCDVYRVPADWSTAAFPMAAAAVTGRDVTIQGPDLKDVQGDKAIVDVLRDFGIRIDVGDDIRVRGGDLTSPGRIDVSATPDMFPVLAIVAACAAGTTEFVGGAALRDKETDRIRAMAEGLHAMGIQTREQPDGLVVHGGELRPGTVDAHDDHRIHMAFKVAALRAPGTTVSDPECVRISYPDFHADLASLEAA